LNLRWLHGGNNNCRDKATLVCGCNHQVNGLYFWQHETQRFSPHNDNARKFQVMYWRADCKALLFSFGVMDPAVNGQKLQSDAFIQVDALAFLCDYCQEQPEMVSAT
jgi:hypothetical protein